MAVTWTKSWSSSDDGSALGGADLDNIQNDLDSQAMTLSVTQTVTGNKTFSGTNTHSGTNTFSGANTFSNTNTFTGTVTFTSVSVINCLSTTTAVDMKTAASTTLYTVPTGKVLRVAYVVVRDPSASLAGGTSYSFTNFRQTVDLSSMTTANTDYIILDGNNAKYTETAAAATFQITVTTGSTAACTATIDLFGYLST